MIITGKPIYRILRAYHTKLFFANGIHILAQKKKKYIKYYEYSTTGSTTSATIVYLYLYIYIYPYY